MCDTSQKFPNGFPTCPVLFSMFGAAYIAIYQAILQQRRHWEMLYTIYAFTVRNILLHTYVINRFPTLGFFKLLICICPFFCPAQVHSKCWCHIWFCVAQFFLQCYSLGCVLLRVTGIQGNEQRLWIHCYSFDFDCVLRRVQIAHLFTHMTYLIYPSPLCNVLH